MAYVISEQAESGCDIAEGASSWRCPQSGLPSLLMTSRKRHSPSDDIIGQGTFSGDGITGRKQSPCDDVVERRPYV